MINFQEIGGQMKNKLVEAASIYNSYLTKVDGMVIMLNMALTFT